MKKYVTHFDSNPDMEKDASAARGSFWLMRKFGTRNKKKLWEILEEIHLKCGNQTKCLRSDLIDATYGNHSVQNAINTMQA